MGAGAFARWLSRYRGFARWQGKLIGTIYLGLGVRLALEKR
jgi:threonine/homoserine/homoserine lactone efflux protein